MKLKVKNRVVKDEKGRVIYKQYRPKGRKHYNIEIWFDGNDSELESINNVKYILHESFLNRDRVSNKPDENFKISIWTWGIFEMKVEINYKDNRTDELDYYLKYKLPVNVPKNYSKVN